MPGALKTGTVLMRTGTFIPEPAWVKEETYSPGWQLITNLDGDGLDRHIRRNNWHFFFMGAALRGTSWGSWSGTTVRCAAIRVLRKTKPTELNCFEITDIYTRRFLGLRYVSVVGHSRHIQKNTVLQSMAERIPQAGQPAVISASTIPGAAPLSAPAIAR
jgi:hypothetical protein